MAKTLNANDATKQTSTAQASHADAANTSTAQASHADAANASTVSTAAANRIPMLRAWKHDTWVRPFFKQYKKLLAYSLIFGVLALAFAALLMFTSGYLISLSAERPELGVYALFIPLAFVQIFGIGKPFFAYWERLRSHDWVFRMTSNLRLNLYRSIEKNGVFYHATHKAGEALGLLTEDIGHVQNLYLRTIFPFIVALVVGFGACLVFGCVNWRMGLLMLLFVAVYVFLVPALSVLINGKRQMKAKTQTNALYTQAYDNIAGIEDWVCSGRESDYVARLTQEADERSHTRRQLSASARNRGLVVELLFGALTLVVLWWAAWQFCSMGFTEAATGLADRAADWVAAFVLGFFPLLEAFQPLGGAAVEANAHADSLERFNAMPSPAISQAEAARAANPPVPSSAELVLNDVHFSYEDGVEVLKGINLTIRPGEKVAILGPSGAGKSTLASLMRGDLTSSQGSVLLGGVPTCEFGNAIASHLSVITQETYLFNRTLFDNLAMDNPDVTPEMARAALAAVGLLPLLETLPQGLDTLVDEAGLRFSGGQRHRIALARVLLQDTPLVLLDEPTVALDPITEHAVLCATFEALKDKTVIIITHHLMDVDKMDRVLFVEDGRIAIDGSPVLLAATNPRYQQLLAFDRGL